ncbi:DUF2167 domain-containing protein [Sulfitobacter sp. R18_1]|uniref:DUF2167 domain-containing protein n=1 Tax=Sulfitobacter sp. R18_1 TaxID=2821104 RepID=UPI001ADD5D8D|nr:DUF2167 domain-containing protein [Sulfitobacter sp. R18_1]MBO9428770.1 DUF2167 domain-containing protein [Sulfitobacter sp. R18_1]
MSILKSQNSFRGFLKEHLCFLVVSFVCYNTMPAVVHAQGTGSPTVFTEALPLSRGEYVPGSQGGFVVPKSMWCPMVLNDWGWESCDGIDKLLVATQEGLDTLLIEKPNSEGYVSFEDWESNEREEVIDDIEAHLRAGAKSQTANTGGDIRFEGWQVYPTLNKARGYMYYASRYNWDGRVTSNITAIVFDRKGYVEFGIVPENSNLSEPQVVAMINGALDSYKPAPQQSYASFVTGDKVAAVGAVGVLAGLVGVKYGKAAATGLMALAMLLLKKLWILVFLPFIWIGKLFNRKRPES